MRTQNKLLFAAIPRVSLAPIFAALALLVLASLVALATAFRPPEQAPFAPVPSVQGARPATGADTAASPPAGEKNARRPGWIWM